MQNLCCVKSLIPDVLYEMTRSRNKNPFKFESLLLLLRELIIVFLYHCNITNMFFV